MWPKQAQFMVWASVRVSDYNLPHWKAGTIAFALAIAMRGETPTQVVYRFASFLPCFYYWTFSFLFCFVLFFHGDSLSLSCKKYHRVAYMAMILNRPHPATQPVLSKPTFLFSVWQEKQEREREREKRLKEWISRPKHKKPVALGHPPNRWDVFLATSGDTIPLFGRDTTAFKRLNAQVVSSTLVLEEPIHYALQICSHQFSKETFHADGSNSNQFSAISSVTSPFSL